MKICIVGGSGFIGSALAKLLKLNNIDFYIIDKVLSSMYPSITRKVDVRNYSDVFNAIDNDTDLIILLAAEHRDNVVPSSLYTDVNVNGAINIAKAAKNKGINKIIFTSSVAIYGLGTTDIGEDATANPFNEYGASKLQAENELVKWQKEDIETRALVIIRPTVVFGPGNRGNVYNLFKHLSKKYLVIVGNGKNMKSIAYVDNVAAFLCHCRQFKAGVHVYNYSDKPDLSINELIKLVRDKLELSSSVLIRIPYFVALLIGYTFDLLALIFKMKSYSISAVRVKKFCANSTYMTSYEKSGFIPPYDIPSALSHTLEYEYEELMQG